MPWNGVPTRYALEAQQDTSAGGRRGTDRPQISIKNFSPRFGHALFVDDADKFNTLFDEFLTSLE